jgi:hypothetical protein
MIFSFYMDFEEAPYCLISHLDSAQRSDRGIADASCKLAGSTHPLRRVKTERTAGALLTSSAAPQT